MGSGPKQASVKSDPDFSQAYHSALACFRESLEAEAYRRGAPGWQEPVFQGGEQVGAITRYSDRLLELLLKRHMPEFRERVSVERKTSSGVLMVPAIEASADGHGTRAKETTAQRKSVEHETEKSSETTR